MSYNLTAPRFSIESKRRTKRGLQYEKAAFPRNSYGLGVIQPDETRKLVFTFDKIALIRGLSTQVQMNVVYLTDGTARRLTIGNGKGILFKHTAPKNLAFRSRTAMYITFALKELGQDGVTQEHIGRIRELVQAEKKENILADAALIPCWIMNIIEKAYE